MRLQNIERPFQRNYWIGPELPYGGHVRLSGLGQLMITIT